MGGGTTLNYTHLDPRLHEIAGQSVDARISYCLGDRYIPYAYSENLISEVYWIVQEVESKRPKCMLLFGDSGCGKSMILSEVTRRLGRGGSNSQSVPIVSVTIPGTSDMKLFFIRILRELDYPFSSKDRKDQLYDQAVMALKAARTKLLVIDELHNLLLSRRELAECMVCIRDLANLPLSILAAGTKTVRTCVAADDQLRHRFRCHALRRWAVNREVRDFVATLESRLPLRAPSDLSEKETLTHLVSRSGGHPATLVTVIREAARSALMAGEERISRAILDEVLTKVLAEKYEATG